MYAGHDRRVRLTAWTLVGLLVAASLLVALLGPEGAEGGIKKKIFLKKAKKAAKMAMLGKLMGGSKKTIILFPFMMPMKMGHAMPFSMPMMSGGGGYDMGGGYGGGNCCGGY